MAKGGMKVERPRVGHARRGPNATARGSFDESDRAVAQCFGASVVSPLMSRNGSRRLNVL